jgi:hypothetical protein
MLGPTFPIWERKAREAAAESEGHHVHAFGTDSDARCHLPILRDRPDEQAEW